MIMKPVNKILLALGVFALTFASCEDVVEQQGPAPAVPENCLGISFPLSEKYNKSVYEMEPTATREITLAMSRTKVGTAVAVPITVDVNDSSVFVVPDSVHFAANDTVATFKVTFPDAKDGITYNLKLSVSGADYVNPYMTNLYVATSVTLIKWEDAKAPGVMIDGLVANFFNTPPAAFYVNYKKAELGDGIIKYRFLNPYTTLPEYKDPSAAEPEAIADADGIFGGYPHNYPGDVDKSKDYNMVIIVQNDTASMEPFALGMDWGYGMISGGSIYGYLSDPSITIDKYPLGTVKDDIITFGANSLFSSMANFQNGGAFPSAAVTTIYLTKEAYLKASAVIEDYNEVDYEPISGAISEFSSEMQEQSWKQSFAKAIDIDAENENSEYKNLYYLPDLYTDGYGLAFYYDETSGRLTIPSNQPVGLEIFGQKIYMSVSSKIATGMAKAPNGVETYTFGISFHYADGTALGDFKEVFYYSKDAISFSMDDFCGDFIMTGYTLFEGGTDAEMEVKIEKYGANNDSLVITGVDFAEEIYAAFDAEYSIMSIAPQTLADFNMGGTLYDMALLTVDKTTRQPSGSALLDFGVGVSGNLFVDDLSAAVGYVIESKAAGGYADGYYNIVFTPVSTKKGVAKSAKSVRAHGQIVMEEETRGNKLSVQDRNIYKERKQHVLQPASMRLY